MIDCKINTPDITPELVQMAAGILKDYLNKDLLELPAVIDNIVIYIRNGAPTMLACGDRKQAEQIMEEMTTGRSTRGIIN